MPEYWFNYGVTEVSMEVPEEISQRKLDFKQSGIDEAIWHRLRSFAEEVLSEAGGGGIAILYDYVEEDLSLSILKHLIESFIEEEAGERITLLTTCWRLYQANRMEHLGRSLKKYGISIKAIDASKTEKTYFHGVEVSKQFLDASARIVITGSELHGLLESASIKEALILGGALNLEFGGDLGDSIKSAWEEIAGRLPFYAVTTVNEEIYFGEAEKVESEVSSVLRSKFVIPVEDAEIIIMGGGGHPRDSTLQNVLHLLGLLKDSVVEGGLIGIIAECKDGLGSDSFLESLLKGGGRGLERGLIELAKEVAEEKRVAFTTSLPKSILKDLLNIRGFDAPQELLTYSLRIYSRNARLLISDKPKIKPIRSRTPERS